MKIVFAAFLSFLSLGAIGFEPGLPQLENKCASLEKGASEEMAFLEGQNLILIPLNAEVCKQLQGHYSGAYYEKIGTLYGKVIFNISCSDLSKPLTVEVFTKKKKRLLKFEGSGVHRAQKETSIVLKSSEAVGRIDYSESAPLWKMYFRMKNGEAFLVNVTKDKKRKMPTPKVETED